VDDSAAALGTNKGNLLDRLAQVRELPAIIFLLMSLVILSAVAPNFGSSTNLLSIARETAIVGIMGVGMTLVILTGGIDLSVASILALSAAVSATLMMRGTSTLVSTFVGLCTGCACGFANALLITVLRVPPIITTLGTMGILRAAVTLYTGAHSIGPLPSSFDIVGTGPISALLLALTAAAATFFVSRLSVGRYVLAIGSNEEAVRLSGIDVDKVKILVYTLNGLLAAVAGMVVASSVNSAQSNTALGYELNVIAAVVMGGTSISGGQGSIPGTVVGAAIMSVMSSALILLGASVHWHKLIVGGVILTAVLIDKFRTTHKQ